MLVVMCEQMLKSIEHTEALSDRPATVLDTTKVIHVLKLLACHNSG